MKTFEIILEYFAREFNETRDLSMRRKESESVRDFIARQQGDFDNFLNEHPNVQGYTLDFRDPYLYRLSLREIPPGLEVPPPTRDPEDQMAYARAEGERLAEEIKSNLAGWEGNAEACAAFMSKIIEVIPPVIFSTYADVRDSVRSALSPIIGTEKTPEKLEEIKKNIYDALSKYDLRPLAEGGDVTGVEQDSTDPSRFIINMRVPRWMVEQFLEEKDGYPDQKEPSR